MSSSNDPIKILAGRFASLPTRVRMEVAERLLRWRDEMEVPKQAGDARPPCSCAPQKSLLEHFWDEVEAAHGDGLYPSNPFAPSKPQRVLYAVEDSPLPSHV